MCVCVHPLVPRRLLASPSECESVYVVAYVCPPATTADRISWRTDGQLCEQLVRSLVNQPVSWLPSAAAAVKSEFAEVAALGNLNWILCAFVRAHLDRRQCAVV